MLRMQDQLGTRKPISEDELSQVLGVFLERRPNAVQIESLDTVMSGEGFGLNSDIYIVSITYGTHHASPVPHEVLIKEYKPRLIGASSSRTKSGEGAYARELSFYELANARIFARGNGERLFPKCYNAGIESGIHSDEVTETLNELKRRRILVLELLRENLDTRLGKIRNQYNKLKSDIEVVKLDQGNHQKQDLAYLVSTTADLESEIKHIAQEGLRTTRHFHDELGAAIRNGATILTGNTLNKKSLVHKYLQYNRILRPSQRLHKKHKREINLWYQSIAGLLLGLDERTQGLTGAIHADLHHGNIVLDARGKIRFTDAANIITHGATVAFDIAPQLFNPPVVTFDLDGIDSMIDASYLEGASISGSTLKDLTLATILAGHNWCYKAASAITVAQQKSWGQYMKFISAHKNHEDAIPNYLKCAQDLLGFLLEHESEFSLDQKLSDSIKGIRDMGHKLHGKHIETGTVQTTP